MDANALAELESLCGVVFGGAQISPLEKIEAQRQLLRLQSSAQFLPQLQYTLENSSSEYALVFAAKGMLLILTNDWRNVGNQQRQQLQLFLLNMLTKYSDPRKFITREIIHVLCRLTKLGWCSDTSLRGLMDEVVKFLTAGVGPAVLGLRILSELVTEFELGRSEINGRLDPEGRMVAQAFREQDGLTRVFMVTLESLNRAFQSSNPNQDRPVLREALSTLHVCLAYDFVGTGYSESDDVVACLYIPIEWTKHIATPQALRMLFQLYDAQWQVQNKNEVDGSDNGPSSLALQCIAFVASTRRSVFDDKSRQEFLVALLEGTTKLMHEKTGLSYSESCLHHLCRVLSRIKSHFQLVELAKPTQYHVWLQTLAVFTEDILSAWRSVSSRSVQYLIRLWGALVLPTPYLRMKDGLSRNHDRSQSQGIDDDNGRQLPDYLRGLDQYVPRVVRAFIATRADMCSAAALTELDDASGGDGALLGNAESNGYGSFGDNGGGIEDSPLDDEGTLLEQLAPLSLLARFRYALSANALGELFLKAMKDREEAIGLLVSNQQGSPQANQGRLRLADAQARLAFHTYLIGAVVGSHVTRVSARAIDRLEEFNAELAALVFKMVTESQRIEDLIQSRGESPAVLVFGFGSNAGWRLELATLYFFRCFQTLYVESRAREDEMEKRQRAPIEMMEDPGGFMSYSFMRRGGISAGPMGALMSVAGPGTSMIMSGGSGGGGASGVFPMFQIRAAPSASPSLDMINRLLPAFPGRSRASVEDAKKGDDDMDASGNDKETTPCPSPIVVDELSAAEIAKKEEKMNEEASERAAAIQRSIAVRVGIQGGDRALLDIAMRRIFGLLQYAQHANEQRNTNVDESSAPVMLVQRALNVLYQLSVGVTIVHAGHASRPRLVNSGRLLLESEVIRDLLRNPSADRFPLLREPKHGRARTFLMATLSKLLYTQIRYPSSQDNSQVPEDMFDVDAAVLTSQDKVDERFIEFMKPMTTVADGLLQMAKANSMDLRQSQIKDPMIGLFRDLRGVVSSATSAREYELVFSWFFPERVRLLQAAASVWNDNSDVMVPLLKLLSELVHNRGSRIVFPHMSAGGLVLFREAAKVLIAFCKPQLQALEQTRRLQRGKQEQREMIKQKLGDMRSDVSSTLQQAFGQENGNDPMSMQALQEAVEALGEEFYSGSDSKSSAAKINNTVVELGPGSVGPGVTVDLESSQQKCSRICLVILSRMLSGRYALLGTFQLFGDNSLLETRSTVLELALSGDPKHVMSFPKMAKALIQLLGHLSEQTMSLIDLSSPLFGRIMACLGEALVSQQGNFSTPAAKAIETIAVFRCKAVAAVHVSNDSNSNGESGQDALQRIRAVLNPEHRSRGDTTSLEDYQKAARLFSMHEQAHPHLFGSLLALVMHTIFSSTLDSPSQWALAKPVMPLILTAPNVFEQQRSEFLLAQSSSREPRIREEYDLLFSKLGPAMHNPALFNVLLRNIDAFSKHLCTFCRNVRRE